MKAIKCDRCKKYYDPYKPGKNTYESNLLIFAQDGGPTNAIGYYWENRQFELCPECMQDAVKFMQAKLPPVKE